MIRRLLSFLVLAWLLGFALFAALLPRPAGDERTHAIVVLTGAGGRIERGLDLLSRKRAQRMLVSGVDRVVRRRELAHEYPASRRLFACCIDLGKESVDTRSNAEEVARWMRRRKFSSLRLVTTDWHMPRARFELARRLPDNVRLVGDAVRSEPRLGILFVEYNKYLLRRAAAGLGA